MKTMKEYQSKHFSMMNFIFFPHIATPFDSDILPFVECVLFLLLLYAFLFIISGEVSIASLSAATVFFLLFLVVIFFYVHFWDQSSQSYSRHRRRIEKKLTAGQSFGVFVFAFFVYSIKRARCQTFSQRNFAKPTMFAKNNHSVNV